MKQFKSQRDIFIISFIFTVANFLLFKWYADLPLHATLIKCLITFILNYLFWTTLSINSYVLKFFLILLSTTSIILVYGCYIYNLSPLVNSVRLFLQTDFIEIKELLTLSAIIPLLITAIIGTIIIKSRFQTKWYYSLLAFTLGTSLIALVNKFDDKNGMIGTHEATLEELSTRLPFNVFIDWVFELKKTVQSAKLTDLSQEMLFSRDKDDNDLLIIFIIGESARFDKFHLNGYSQQTSPYLDKQKQLLSLKEYYALETSTVTAMPYLFKRSNHREFINKNESSFVSVLKHLGFKTYYLSLQTDIKKELYQLAMEHDYYALGTKMRSLTKKEKFYDEDLLIPLKKIIRNKKNQLVVLHTMGSHYRYKDRIPESFNSDQFSDYDNTIRYTDFILNSVIEMTKQRNTLIIYSSDHGESLSGDKVKFHSHPYHLALTDTPEQLHIPGFWFFSNRFLENRNNRILYNNFLHNMQKRLDQSYMFHSLLGCAGVSSKAIQTEKNLCAG